MIWTLGNIIDEAPEVDEATWEAIESLDPRRIQSMFRVPSDILNRVGRSGVAMLIEQAAENYRSVAMPKGTKVAKCVDKVMKSGKAKGNAISICQSSTGKSYKTGRKPKKKR